MDTLTLCFADNLSLSEEINSELKIMIFNSQLNTDNIPPYAKSLSDPMFSVQTLLLPSEDLSCMVMEKCLTPKASKENIPT